MSKFEYKNESGYSIWIEAETQEKANEIFDKLFHTKKVVKSE